MRRTVALLAGHFTICGLAWAAAQDLPYPGDPPPGEGPSGVYVALRGSLTFDGRGANVSIPTTPTATALRPSHDVGGGASLALGTELPFELRAETELLYRNRPVKNVTLGSTTAAGGGHNQNAALMANLVWAPKFDGMPIRPYIGGGVGTAYTYGQINDASGANIYLQNTGWHFAYQGMAGLEIPLMPGASLTAGYRWMHTDNVRGRCGTSGLAPALACTKYGFDDQGVDLGFKIDLP